MINTLNNRMLVIFFDFILDKNNIMNTYELQGIFYYVVYVCLCVLLQVYIQKSVVSLVNDKYGE